MSSRHDDNHFKIGDVVRLNSGGHQMTVSEVDDVGVTCQWSDGKKVLQKVFAPALLQSINEVSGINIQIVYPEKDIQSIVAEAQACADPLDDADALNISLSELRRILKKHLGPNQEPPWNSPL